MPRRHWHRLGLRFTFDDREPQLIPVNDLFGISWVNEPPARSVLFGADADDDLYCYFPMPFFDAAEVELMRRPVEGPARLRVEYAVRRSGSPPPDGAGFFGVQIRDTAANPATDVVPILELDGSGSWVGLFARFGPAKDLDSTFLEADEQVFVNGEESPSWHGTGVEDFFSGGFYFRGPDRTPAAFRQPLHGAPVVRFLGRSAPVMYRLLLGDAVVFSTGLRAELEHISVGGGSVPLRSVAYYYVR